MRPARSASRKPCAPIASSSPATWAISSSSSVSANIPSICAATIMSPADRARNSRSIGSPLDDSTDGTYVSHTASSTLRWVSLRTAAATAKDSPLSKDARS